MIPIVIAITPIATEIAAKLFQVICMGQIYRRTRFRLRAIVVPIMTMSTMLTIRVMVVKSSSIIGVQASDKYRSARTRTEVLE